MGGGISKEQHYADIDALNESWRRTTEEERKKITEIMRKQNVKFEDLLKEQAKREELISELRKENIELKDEIFSMKAHIESIAEFISKLAITGKDDREEDQCSVAKLLFENGHGPQLRKIRKLLTEEEFKTNKDEDKMEMFLTENLNELLDGPLKQAYAALLSAHKNGLSCSECYREMKDPVNVSTCSLSNVRCVKCCSKADDI